VTTTFSPSLGHVTGQSHRPAAVHRPATTPTPSVRSTGTGVTVAIVAVASAAVAAALGFAALTLGLHPAPASHAVVTPAPHQPAVLGHGTLPVVHLPTAPV
jgi:hypothetical protein